jgi:hypothetical protein
MENHIDDLGVCEHPADLCVPHWCLVQPTISPDGHVLGRSGYHRSDVHTTPISTGYVAQVGVGQEEDHLDEPLVHLYLLENAGDSSLAVVLTPSEADALAAALTRTAKTVRTTAAQWRQLVWVRKGMGAR